jgi:AraC-like DNA-binding protein
MRMLKSQTSGPAVNGEPLTAAAAAPLAAEHAGLFRAFLAGPSGTLADAFANLERTPGVQVTARHARRGLLGARVVFPPQQGEGSWELTRIGDDAYVVVANVSYRNSRRELVPGDGMIQFYFKLSGDLTLAVSQTEPLRLNRPSLLVYFQPVGFDMQEWSAPSIRERSVTVNVRAEYLIENFVTSPQEAPPQLSALLTGSPRQFNYCQLPLSPSMFELAARLVDSTYTGVLALVHTEATVLELLCAAVAQLGALQAAPIEQFGEHDLRCLHAARGLLTRQFAPAPTIRQVARAVGMSETSLKRGFKSLFGETLFDFSVRCRMQHALGLLREQRLPVARVAEAVGYSHQTSFATAFHRHFGLCPKDVRGQKSR